MKKLYRDRDRKEVQPEMSTKEFMSYDEFDINIRWASPFAQTIFDSIFTMANDTISNGGKPYEIGIPDKDEINQFVNDLIYIKNSFRFITNFLVDTNCYQIDVRRDGHLVQLYIRIDKDSTLYKILNKDPIGDMIAEGQESSTDTSIKDVFVDLD